MPLVRGRKESKLVRSLVLFVKLGVRYGRRLATPIPSSNRHIPCIRTLRIGLNLPQLHEVQSHCAARHNIVVANGDNNKKTLTVR